MIPVTRSSDNGKWKVTKARSAFPGHVTGGVFDHIGDRAYIWSYINGQVHYLQEPRTPKNIPAYVKSIVRELVSDEVRDWDNSFKKECPHDSNSNRLGREGALAEPLPVLVEETPYTMPEVRIGLPDEKVY